MAELLPIGTEAPDFTLKSSPAHEHSLFALRGKPVVVSRKLSFPLLADFESPSASSARSAPAQSAQKEMRA